MIPKLRAACYIVRSTVHVSNIIPLKSVYCAYFHYVIKYGILGRRVNLPTREDFYFAKENHQNYGWSTTQHLM